MKSTHKSKWFDNGEIKRWNKIKVSPKSEWSYNGEIESSMEIASFELYYFHLGLSKELDDEDIVKNKLEKCLTDVYFKVFRELN